MALRAPNLGDNSFALLATGPPSEKKRKKKFTEFPILPEPIQPKTNPKYVVVTSLTENKPLTQFSCFAVEKSLHIISKDIISVAELRDGSLLLLVENRQVAQKFLAAKQLAGLCEIKCKYHENLNFVKGTIFAPYLSHVPDDEIVKNLEAQGVVSVYKFKKAGQDTGVVLLTFDLYNLPETLNISWHKVKVRDYIPSPMRCKQCQKLGHTMKHCEKDPKCVNCNLALHAESDCLRTQCANCEGEHPSNSNNCPNYIQQREILKIKIKQRCTMKQARALYTAQFPQPSQPDSYAGVTADPDKNQPKKPNSQTLNKATSSAITLNHKDNPSTSKTLSKDKNERTVFNLKSKTTETPIKTSESSTATTTSTLTNATTAIDSYYNNKLTTSKTSLNRNKTTENTMSMETDTTTTSGTTDTPSTSTTASIEARSAKLTSILSPITNLTQQLLKQNDYYSTYLGSSDSDVEMSK